MHINTMKYLEQNNFVKDNRHFLPSIKEWFSGIYSYNKNEIKEIHHKDNAINNLMRTHFHSSPSNIKRARSRRMRNLIRRSSLKRIFVSLPEIKHNLDKAIISFYLFDRENDLIKRKIFFIRKFLKKILTQKTNVLKLKMVNIAVKKVVKRVKIRKSIRKKRILKNRIIRKYKLKYDMICRQAISHFAKKQLFLKRLFIFAFVKWVLTKLYGMSMNIYYACKSCSRKGVHNMSVKGTKCSTCNRKRKLTGLNKFVISKNNVDFVVINNLSYNNLAKVNNICLGLTYNLMKKNLGRIDANFKLKKIFSSFTKSNYKYFLYRFLKKENYIITKISNLQFNRFKFSNFLPSIKNYVTDVYNKKIEFNLVRLKYLHLSSDTFLESIVVKLRKKKSSLLRVIGKSLKLMKIPKQFSAALENSNSKEDKKNFNDINYNILNSIKHKWIVGARLEAKGRLTKRYTASRALFKYVNKGNLKNHYNSYSKEYILNSPTVHMIRGQFKPNLQYTYYFSNKRIGTFGIKGWINSV